MPKKSTLTRVWAIDVVQTDAGGFRIVTSRIISVQEYNHAEISLLTEKREFDKIAQTVDEGIFTVPLSYTPVQEGIIA